MTDAPCTFEFQLKPVLMKLGLSQRKLAGLLKCKLKEVSRYAMGHTAPSWSRLIAIARVLGVTLGVFFDGDPAYAEFFAVKPVKVKAKRKGVSNA